jgi:alkylhydroperoxidase/carboxymuconolactone decarboxylase family protein YurZ
VAAPSGADAVRAGAIEFHVLCVMKTACARADNGAELEYLGQTGARIPGRLPERPGDVAGLAGSQKGGSVVDYAERLRRLVINDACFAGAGTSGTEVEARDLDPKTLALVRLAALVAVGGAVPSYGAHTDAAVNAGATAAEIVDVLVGVIPVVGLPAVVATAAKLALALGHDAGEALEL